MTKDEFLQRFQLKSLSQSEKQHHLLNQPNALIESAVLIALTNKNNQLCILLTKRAPHLKHHPGQISFPGGKVEKSDLNLNATALREAKEEVGLTKKNIQIIGQLHPYQTITGFQITPIVAFLQSNSATQIDKNEVDEIFYVPIQHFLNNKQHFTIDVQHKKTHSKFHFMPYKHHNIWGATAAILKDLVEHIT